MIDMEYRPRTSVEAVRRATGHDWDEWFATLDKWGATAHDHGEIAAYLAAEHGVGSWWTQAITVEYERARGLRPVGGDRDGRLSITASRTIAAAVDRLYAAFVEDDLRERWMPGGVLRLRTGQPGRSARFDVQDGSSRVNVGFEAAGAGRGRVALQHERLADAEAAARAKAYWTERLAVLKTLLEG